MPNCTRPMDQWTPEEVSAHIAFMDHVADELRERGEFVDAQALSPEGTFVRFDGEGKPPVTDGPFAETKDLIAGWMVIDVESVERAHEAAAFLSSAPGPGGEPMQEWIEVRPFLEMPPSPTDRADVMDQLVRELVPQVLGILVRRGADFAAAEDAVQEALVEAVRRWPDDPPDDPKAWLVTVAWRKFIDAGRSESARRRREERVVDEPAPGTDRGPGRHPAAALPLLPPRALAARRRSRSPCARSAGSPPRRSPRPTSCPSRRWRSGSAAPSAPSPSEGVGRAGRPAAGAQGPLPDLQRGLLRRRRPRRRGDPADPDADAAPATSPRWPGCWR